MQRIHGEYVNVCVDQSIDRCPIAKESRPSGPLASPTLCGHTKMWMGFRPKGKKKAAPPRQRLLTGREALSLQGFPHARVRNIDDFSDSLLTNLAGNAYPLPVIMAILMAVLVTVP